ncbi:MAG: AMP-binding protein [Candidatus Rokubacteria bacterium]|nr:AMP-binding protein [Candidatus Rokubacteria bacterium]
MRDNPFWNKTVGQMLDETSTRHQEREAMVFRDERISYREFKRQADRLARGLYALGVRKNDKVAIWLPNRPAWLFCQYACAKLGATVVALNPRYKAHELSYILSQSDSTTLILTDHLAHVDFFEVLHEVLPDLKTAEPGNVASEKFPLLKRVIVDAEDPYPGCLRLQDVLEAGDNSELEAELSTRQSAAQPDDVFTILYTSGTTSFPKGAVITHRNCVPHGWWCGEVMRMGPADRVLHALPLSGTWGGLCVPLSTFTHGAALVLMETFDAGLALHLIERERITMWNGVDAMALAVLEHPDLARRDRSSLRAGAFATTGGGIHGLFEAVVQTIGLKHAFQPYGMTEVNALAMAHDLDEPLESRALPGVWAADGIEMRVVDPETGRDKAAGEEGELWLRGRLVTRGYYKKPEETARAFTADGWFKTGDLAVRDEQGRTIFRGRLREVLRISHFMVAPGEIEAYLQSHPKVLQAFVIGVPDPRTTEAAVAYVIPRPGETLTEADVIAHCRGRIASFKIPRAVRVVADVPRTPGPHGDKVQKARLREMFLAESR